MPYKIVVTEEARLDMLDAYRYYEQQQSGLGERFWEALQDRFTDLSNNPEYYSFINNQQIFRDIVLDKFPYVIIYELSDQDVIIYAIFPTHKDSDKKYQ